MSKRLLTTLALGVIVAAGCAADVRTTEPPPTEKPGVPTQPAPIPPAPVPRPTARIQVVTTTSGSDPDVDGYTLRMSGMNVDTLEPLVASGSVTTQAYVTGGYTVVLQGVAENCAVSVSSTRFLQLLDTTTTTVAFNVTCVPPGQLAFVRDGDIYTARTNGVSVTRLTTSASGVSNGAPAWSPDGRRIAFVREQGTHSDIYVMDADGSNVVRRTDSGTNAAPSWSPDGRKLGFMSNRGGDFLLYLTASEGVIARPTQIGYSRGYNADPAWSPDGQRIAFVSDWWAYDFLYDLHVMDADGSKPTTLLAGAYPGDARQAFYFQPVWSPDGTRIALVTCGYSWDTCYPNSAIATVDANGSGLSIVSGSGGFSRPSWSPDGRTLAFSSSTCRTCASSIRYARVDGTHQDVIVSNASSPAWRR